MRRKLSTGKKVWYFVILPLFLLILIYIILTRFFYVTTVKQAIPFNTKTYNVIYCYDNPVELEDVYEHFKNVRLKRTFMPEFQDDVDDGFNANWVYHFGTKNIKYEYSIVVFEKQHMILFRDALIGKNIKIYKYKER